MSFDKVGKLIKEDRHESSHVPEGNDLLRIIGRVRRLRESSRAVFCRWVKLGFIEGVHALVSPMGTVTLTDWSSEIDSLIHDLVSNGVAVMNDRGYVEIPHMMNWNNIADLDLACDTVDETNIETGEIIYPSPMIMKLPPPRELIEEAYDDLQKAFANAVNGLSYYISGEVAYVGLNVKSLGFINPILLRSPIDALVVTSNRLTMAHKIIDPSRTVHRGLSSLEHYLMDGLDYAILVHKYTYYEMHVETFNKILSRPLIRDAGFIIVPYELDYLIFLKWPHYNSLIARSRTIAVKRALINNAVGFMINAR